MLEHFCCLSICVQTFEVNSWVWVPDDREMYLPAKVMGNFKPGEEGNVKFEDGKVCCGVRQQR